MGECYLRRSRWVIGMAFLFLTLLQVKGYAETGVDYSIEISQKLGRGILNLLSSPLEIPCTIRDEVSEKGAPGVGAGFFKGILFFLRRALVGVTEAGTFMIPMEAALPPVCAKKAEAQLERS